VSTLGNCPDCLRLAMRAGAVSATLTTGFTLLASAHVLVYSARLERALRTTPLTVGARVGAAAQLGLLFARSSWKAPARRAEAPR